MILGELSKRYESNGEPGCISSGNGDSGGKSYGMYQLSSVMGSVAEYLEWLRINGYWFYDYLAEWEIGSPEFDSVWRNLANGANREDFEASQHLYIKHAYYDVAIRLLEAEGFHIENHSEVMKDVVWSRSVQYGPGLIVEMYQEACHRMYNAQEKQYTGYPNLTYIDDKRFDYDLIYSIYHLVCQTEEWTNGSPELRYGLYARYDLECAEALDKLKEEL